MIPLTLRDRLAEHLGAEVRRVEPVVGGCIARACRVETGAGTYFLKWGRGDVARTFWAEADGLQALREAGAPLIVPEVLVLGDADDATPGFLLMAWIEPGPPRDGFWEALAHGLVALHRHTAPRYGYDEDNYLGRSVQHNDWQATWPAFFRACRLAPQVRRAREQGRWQRRWDRPLERLYERLPELLPERPETSLVHGDLWHGNVMTTAAGPPALIDPAVYFGHREVDLAMTELFGGFDPAFYEAYRAAWPLEPGYEERREVYNLYHLLNHLNLFGAGYAGSIDKVLRRYA
ncbi:MAG: fructosamine kinase [Rhodothermaceae bacterium]|nr:MAG: fructosamine kinase [Rhodothermaceae bacterium]